MVERRQVLGSRILLTGASSGIGWQVALQLADQGAHVIATARRANRLADLEVEFARRLAAKESISQSGTLVTIAGDITSLEHRRQLIQACQERWGALDCLINNAGAGAIGPFSEASEERLRQVMEIDFFAPVGLIRESIPLLKLGNRGAIVNVGSVLSLRGVPNKSEYCAAKFALRGLSESLRCELASQAIQVIVIHPSTTRSEFFDTLIDTDPLAKTQSIGSMSAEQVAKAIISAWVKGKRESVLSAGGRFFVWAGRFFPRTTDRLLNRFAK